MDGWREEGGREGTKKTYLDCKKAAVFLAASSGTAAKARRGFDIAWRQQKGMKEGGREGGMEGERDGCCKRTSIIRGQQFFWQC
jgi:hypothetical protein